MFPTKQYIKTGFMNWDAFKKPCSEYICKFCAFSMGEEFRRTSYIAAENRYYPFKNAEIENLLFNLPIKEKTPFIFCVTTSYKKHNCFRARVNYSHENYFIRWEEKLVEIDTKKHFLLFQDLKFLYNSGFSKSEIRSGNYYRKRIEEFGLLELLKWEGKIKPFRGSGVFDFFMDNKTQVIRKEEKEESAKEVKPEKVKPLPIKEKIVVERSEFTQELLF